MTRTCLQTINHVLLHRYIPIKKTFLDKNSNREIPVPLVEQELFTLPEHLSSPLVFSGVRVTRSLVLYVCFVDRCLSFCTFPFGHFVVCPSSIYGFWLLFWYLQTLLVKQIKILSAISWRKQEDDDACFFGLHWAGYL